MSRASGDAIAQALRFAAEAHAGQTVPGTRLPYLLHLAQVMSEVQAALLVEPAEDGELSVLCAILHDVVEDTAVTVAEVAARFGAEVAAGVAALTKDGRLAKSARMADSLARIRRQPKAVWKVKLADRITNLQPPPAHWPRDRCVRYLAEAGGILEALGDASPVLARRFEEKMRAYPGFMPRA